MIYTSYISRELHLKIVDYLYISIEVSVITEDSACPHSLVKRPMLGAASHGSVLEFLNEPLFHCMLKL
jgi:hypothetical protein